MIELVVVGVAVVACFVLAGIMVLVERWLSR